MLPVLLELVPPEPPTGTELPVFVPPDAFDAPLSPFVVVVVVVVVPLVFVAAPFARYGN